MYKVLGENEIIKSANILISNAPIRISLMFRGSFELRVKAMKITWAPFS